MTNTGQKRREEATRMMVHLYLHRVGGWGYSSLYLTPARLSDSRAGLVAISHALFLVRPS